jgi:hypothetical protein
MFPTSCRWGTHWSRNRSRPGRQRIYCKSTLPSSTSISPTNPFFIRPTQRSTFRLTPVLAYVVMPDARGRIQPLLAIDGTHELRLFSFRLSRLSPPIPRWFRVRVSPDSKTCLKYLSSKLQPHLEGQIRIGKTQRLGDSTQCPNEFVHLRVKIAILEVCCHARPNLIRVAVSPVKQISVQVQRDQ